MRFTAATVLSSTPLLAAVDGSTSTLSLGQAAHHRPSNMDLGFGSSNQAVGNLAAQAILQTAQAQERAIEDEISQYDALLNDDRALEAIRAKRLQELQRGQAQRQRWRVAGHGTYQDLADGQNSRDVARAFFEASKASQNLVVHFYRPSSRYCDIFHAHLEKLAGQHLETRFCKINVEGCDSQDGGPASFLVEKLGIHVMPTLVLIKDRKSIHHIKGFDELGGTADFSTKALEYVLGYCGVINHDDTEMPPELSNQRGVNAIRLVRDGINAEFEDDSY